MPVSWPRAARELIVQLNPVPCSIPFSLMWTRHYWRGSDRAIASASQSTDVAAAGRYGRAALSGSAGRSVMAARSVMAGDPLRLPDGVVRANRPSGRVKGAGSRRRICWAGASHPAGRGRDSLRRSVRPWDVLLDAQRAGENMGAGRRSARRSVGRCDNRRRAVVQMAVVKTGAARTDVNWADDRRRGVE